MEEDILGQVHTDLWQASPNVYYVPTWDAITMPHAAVSASPKFGQDRLEDAVAAYETPLRLKPDWGFVHRSLAKLYDSLPNRAKEAAWHRAEFRATRKKVV